MSLYIKTSDYRKYGINKYSDLVLVRDAVEKELNISPIFVKFVSGHKFIRVDFLRPRGPRRPRRKRGASRSARQ